MNMLYNSDATIDEWGQRMQRCDPQSHIVPSNKPTLYRKDCTTKRNVNLSGVQSNRKNFCFIDIH